MATPDDVSEPSVLVRASQSLETVQKILTEEAKEHITSMTVKYNYTGHPRITSIVVVGQNRGS